MWNANSQREAEQLRQFVSLTGADEATARRFLEEAVWNVDAARAAYHASEASPTAHQRQGIPKAARGALPRTGGVVTMNDLKRGGKPAEPKGQSYFAGGHSSGLQVQAPSPGQPDVDRLVNSVFSSAASNAEQAQAPQKQWGAGGRRLGDGDGAQEAAAPAPAAAAQQEACRIVFWKNGFTVDDGPLRSYTEARNEEFLRAINEGAVPDELRQRTAGGGLGVQLVDRKGLERPQPKAVPAQPKPFACAGRRLGSEAAAEEESAPEEAAAPATQLQIRTHRGKRLLQKFPGDATVAQLFAFVADAAPPPQGREFALMTTFPTKEVADHSLTLAEAGLLGAVVVQKLR